jgi:hypothetical protein
MKRISFALTIVVASTVCGVANAQDAKEEANLEYEKLKMLDPMVGTYHSMGQNEETGRVWQMRTTIAWSDSKRMLVHELAVRNAETEADLAKQEWQPSQVRLYNVWNHSANRIENFWVRPGIGLVTISEVKHEGDNVFSYSRISTTGDPKWKSDIKAVVNDEGITYLTTNRKNPAGEALEDTELKMKRIED